MSFRFFDRFFLSAFLVIASGWATCGYAVPLTDPDIPVASAPKPKALPESDYVLAQPSAEFVCPHTSRISAIGCFLDAVDHLYTVCRQVKAIELLEFGFASGEQGANGLKSAYCRGKQKITLPPYFEAAQREAQAKSSCEAMVALNDLYMVWNTAMAGLRQQPNETEDDYRQRIAAPYSAFAAYSQQIREALTVDASQRPVQSCPDVTVFQP
ncbi:MAG: hypothetical protein FWF41_01135 [Betaproteobacteria bacterium]|nr:hypothetical protein [Betaproteobacteria bacterium]